MRSYFALAILDLAAWPINSTTIKSIALSLVFSGKCVVAAVPVAAAGREHVR